MKRYLMPENLITRVLKIFDFQLVDVLKVASDIEITRQLDGSIHLHGYKDDVLQHKERINSLVIQQCEQYAKNFERIIRLPTRNIQWEYETSYNWKPFSVYISSLIEDCHENQKSNVLII